SLNYTGGQGREVQIPLRPPWTVAHSRERGDQGRKPARERCRDRTVWIGHRQGYGIAHSQPRDALEFRIGREGIALDEVLHELPRVDSEQVPRFEPRHRPEVRRRIENPDRAGPRRAHLKDRSHTRYAGDGARLFRRPEIGGTAARTKG